MYVSPHLLVTVASVYLGNIFHASWAMPCAFLCCSANSEITRIFSPTSNVCSSVFVSYSIGESIPFSLDRSSMYFLILRKASMDWMWIGTWSRFAFGAGDVVKWTNLLGVDSASSILMADWFNVISDVFSSVVHL